MPRFNRFVFIIFILLTAPSIILAALQFAQPFNRYRTEYVSFPNERGSTVEAILYRPLRDGTRKHPAIVSVHSGLQGRESLQPAARVFVEHGIVVLDVILKRKRSVDDRPKTFEDYVSDVKACADYLLSRDFVERGRVFLSGHSIGGNVSALVAGSHGKVAGEVAVGYPIEFSSGSQCQLLVTAGAFDELHPVSKMLTAFELTVGKKTTSEILTNNRDISSRVAPDRVNRIYFISWLTDHYTEPIDPDIVAATIRFIESLGGETLPSSNPFRGIRAQLFIRIILFVSLFLLFLMALIQVQVTRALNALPGTPQRRIFQRAGILGFIILYLILSLVHRPSEHLIHIYIISAIFLATLMSNHYLRKSPERVFDGASRFVDEEKLARFFLFGSAKVLFFSLSLYVAFILGLFVHAGIYPYARPGTFFQMLMGPMFMVPAQIFVFCTRVNGLFLNNDFTYSSTSPVIWIVAAAELIYPGAVGKILDEFFSRILGSIKKLDFKIRLKFSISEIIIFAVVLIICVLLWRQILAEGYAFGFGELLGMGYLFLSFIVIPFITFTAIIRSGGATRFVDEYIAGKLKVGNS